MYLNGVELRRDHMPSVPVGYDTLANSHEANLFDGPFEITVAELPEGANVFAAEVHQTSIGNSDVVWIAELTLLYIPSVLLPP
jgi:hypothetical protein